MSNSKLLLSIIIPVYNRQQGLDDLINALGESENIGSIKHLVEIIVVDDASIPSIREIKSDFQISYYRLDVNSGAPKARELGFRRSKGEFVHFHDSDDAIAVNWLSNISYRLEEVPSIDILMTARLDLENTGQYYKAQKYFHKKILQVGKIKSRLVYRNCIGPLGGVTFSRRVLKKIEFKGFLSCQDWQMYLHAIEYSHVLYSLPDTLFYFNKMGADRISHNPRKKIIGHLQLAKLTAPKSVFKKNIRLFYLYTCREHIKNKGGLILAFYNKNHFKILVTYIVVSIYWRLT